MWKNFVELGKPQMKIWCMRIACCTAKITDTVNLLLFCSNNGYAIISCLVYNVLQGLHVTLNIMWEKCRDFNVKHWW
jgi:hypothetical protein